MKTGGKGCKHIKKQTNSRTINLPTTNVSVSLGDPASNTHPENIHVRLIQDFWPLPQTTSHASAAKLPA